MVAAVFNVLVRLLWRYRESVLRPSQKLIPAFPRAKAPGSKGSSSSSQQIYTSAELDQLGDLVRQWLQELSKDTGVKKMLVTHRLGPLMPQAVRVAAEAYEAATGEEDMIPVLEAFECYIFDFLVSPTGSSNNSRFQQSRIRHIAEEIVFYTYELIPAIKRVTPVASLYAEMVQVVHSFPQLAYARFWSDIPIITDGPRTIDEAQFTQLLVRKDRRIRMDNFNSALANFITRIAKPDCLGVMAVPYSDYIPSFGTQDPHEALEHGAHLSLAPSLISIRRQAEIVSHQLALIDYAKDFTEWPVVEDSWHLSDEEMEEAFRLPGRAMCGIGNIKLHYQDNEVQAARADAGLDLTNDEINEDALNTSYGCMQSQRYDDDEEEVDKEEENEEGSDGRNDDGNDGDEDKSDSDGPQRKRLRR